MKAQPETLTTETPSLKADVQRTEDTGASNGQLEAEGHKTGEGGERTLDVRVHRLEADATGEKEEHRRAADATTNSGKPTASSTGGRTSLGRRTTRIALAVEQMPRRLVRLTEAEWAPSLLIFAIDLVCWFTLYAALTFVRRDASYSSGFELAIIDGLQLVIIVGCLFISGGYSPRTDMRSLSYTAEHIIAMVAALFVSALAIYSAAAFDHAMRPSRAAVLVSFVAFTPISLLYRRLLSSRVAKASANRAFLVIGAGEIAANFYRTYRSSPNQQRLEFVDCEGKRVGQHVAGPASPLVEGDLASKLDYASRRYSGIILAEGIGLISGATLDRLIRTQFQRTRVYTLESFYEAHWKRVPIHSVDPFWPLQSGFQQLARTSPYHYVKRIFDIVAAFLLLVVSFPILLLIGLGIRLTMGPPVIFKQQRVGRDEVPFMIYKFRTMNVRGEPPRRGDRSSELEDGVGQPAGSGEEEHGRAAEEAGQMSKVEVEDHRLEADATVEDSIYTRPNDPRVTRLGRWLRKLRLDELPQLWNVLKGELSLIGPRAEWVECADRYRKSIPFYHFRHLVKPGITGWAQVNYPYGESDQDAVEKLKYDLYYIRHYSLTLDAMIVLKTVYTMLFGKGR
jgi:exopolysaccharide biosynthesis polyprenyl glycosylphosphotransferase